MPNFSKIEKRGIIQCLGGLLEYGEDCDIAAFRGVYSIDEGIRANIYSAQKDEPKGPLPRRHEYNPGGIILIRDPHFIQVDKKENWNTACEGLLNTVEQLLIDNSYKPAINETDNLGELDDNLVTGK